ncbi:MAG TPA: phosphomannomutase/phosphoglucomutase [Candidatus Babeliales bacterium]|nr:phosphomannomutase/phosphoglucomutase [Candidatus Babeliales bacterium]
MNDVIFRQYDIRGKVGIDLLIDQVYAFGRALAYYFLQKNPQIKTVVVGMDGRVHSAALQEQLTAGLIDSGLNVLFIGTCPSPVMYFAVYNYDVQAGVMITASHNGKEYNGFKIKLGTESVCGDQIQEIKQLFKAQKEVAAQQKGSITREPVVEAYIDWLADHFASLRSMQLSVVVDCGNGAAGTVLPQLVQRMDWPNVQLLYPEVDGTYPHHDANPIEEKNMADVKQILATTDIKLGVGLDGDADRMAAMTKEGYLIPGDKLLGILSKPIVDHHKGTAIVFDSTCSGALAELLAQWGARPIMSPTGSSYIKQYMKKSGALFGGEVSCHFFFADRYFGYDDGIYAMMRLFEIVIESPSLTAKLVEFPVKYGSGNIRIACPDESKEFVVSALKQYFQADPDVTINCLDGIRVLWQGGWGLVRASNTEPKLSVRFEANSQQELHDIRQRFIQALSGYFDRTVLEKDLL